MELVKPKYNIGDAVYYIKNEGKVKAIECHSCSSRRFGIADDMWKYYEECMHINGIKVNFDTKSITYSVIEYFGCFSVGDEWNNEITDIKEDCLFFSLTEAFAECMRRNA